MRSEGETGGVGGNVETTREDPFGVPTLGDQYESRTVQSATK